MFQHQSLYRIVCCNDAGPSTWYVVSNMSPTRSLNRMWNSALKYFLALSFLDNRCHSPKRSETYPDVHEFLDAWHIIKHQSTCHSQKMSFSILFVDKNCCIWFSEMSQTTILDLPIQLGGLHYTCGFKLSTSSEHHAIILKCPSCHRGKLEVWNIQFYLLGSRHSIWWIKYYPERMEMHCSVDSSWSNQPESSS